MAKGFKQTPSKRRGACRCWGVAVSRRVAGVACRWLLLAALMVLPSPEIAPDSLPPVELASLEHVLDEDLAPTLASGDLASGTGAGVTIGVVVHGARRILTYGTTKPDSVFEIGSITKTFTGLILAQMVEQHKVRLDEPVRTLLPSGTVAPPPSGAEITLLDLSTHRSGLPRMPDNFRPADPSNPFADYDTKALYAFIARHGVALPEKPKFLYSNLGVGLLGQALAERAGTTFEALLREQVTGPLGMHDTMFTLSPALDARVVPGHDSQHKPVRAWDDAALCGAGGIRSTAADMLTYLEAQLHPEQLPLAVRATPEGATLAAAIAASHDIGDGTHTALNWGVDEAGFGHDGATGGYSASAIFNPEKDFAVIVLSNTSVDQQGHHRFMDDLARNIVQRLTGKPAVFLGPASDRL
jgi:CubicO group peptidase (beta-lactamase class C family)